MKTIKDMPRHSRPREKLKEKGPAALTDEELVAAILGMGTAGVDVRIHGQLTKAGKILGLSVLDHIIVTRKGYYSFQEAGMIR